MELNRINYYAGQINFIIGLILEILAVVFYEKLPLNMLIIVSMIGLFSYINGIGAILEHKIIESMGGQNVKNKTISD